MVESFRCFFLILLHKNLFCLTDEVYNNAAAAPKFEADIVFGGDISFDSPIRLETGSSCPYPEILKHVSKYLKSADYNMVNLEAPFVLKQNENCSFLPKKGIHNKAWPESVEALTSAGVKAVTLANNHISDYGGDAVDLTIKILADNNIEYVGITYGENAPYSPQIPLIKEINGIKVGFLGYCGDETGECEMFRPGIKTSTALLRKQTVEYDIQQLKSKVDVIVTFVHWGTEYFAIPKETQRDLAVFLSQMGVSLIIGSHPHVMQGHEWLNDTLVHYSLGNFVFHPHFTFMGGQTKIMVYMVQIQHTFVKIAKTTVKTRKEYGVKISHSRPVERMNEPRVNLPNVLLEPMDGPISKNIVF